MPTIGSNLTSALDILNSASGKRRDIGDLSNKVQDSLANVTTGQKFGSRAELDATGLSGRFDNAQAMILKAEANKTTVYVSDGKLKSQQQALIDINKAMVRFEQERAQNSAAAGTDVQKADKALGEIERIMRSKNQSGEYIFGGNDPFTDPLSVIDPVTGNRVAINLKTQSNVVGGSVLVNNYSDAAPDVTVVTVSSAHEVKQGFLYPGMDSMVKTIGYLNMVKTGVVAGVPAVTLADIGAAQDVQRLARGETQVLVNLEIEKVEAARSINLSDINSASAILKEFKGDLVELTGRAKTLLESFVASISIANAGDKAFDALLQNSRI
ncbi:hypothetical protein Megvenef_01291 [Candidatus Megaera venefica]|jgi:hypothetical protein|uniref:Flagellin n=1 Tax=Candidatus Megaera venefica TaxID=2055910 RepID=A0ABU5NDT7_9RICK|nr:hypothetical protein [Candidatus Megaera venefica]MEA0971316.1 hypothetical protein [Candidatus Megaera venefica]